MSWLDLYSMVEVFAMRPFSLTIHIYYSCDFLGNWSTLKRCAAWVHVSCPCSMHLQHASEPGRAPKQCMGLLFLLVSQLFRIARKNKQRFLRQRRCLTCVRWWCFSGYIKPDSEKSTLRNCRCNNCRRSKLNCFL